MNKQINNEDSRILEGKVAFFMFFHHQFVIISLYYIATTSLTQSKYCYRLSLQALKIVFVDSLTFRLFKVDEYIFIEV